ncbi:hypothetical protein B0T26DRAFT_211494 [Lasiosphaeria miniovina]|uniref:Uncharacterized protein n=1 Tax=Lasiosphaeria miniovina TaxID=1954250 RepID=A0AA40DZG1_9PEZI|nr:uncharacterized protein B0T26DRAFT_211494 [Lasiosphaeria miniovina]KAK0722284.1 hypothetical protein B0T26DRAFT_211494 [Lasiosphaeria miniovina]
MYCQKKGRKKRKGNHDFVFVEGRKTDRPLVESPNQNKPSFLVVKEPHTQRESAPRKPDIKPNRNKKRHTRRNEKERKEPKEYQLAVPFRTHTKDNQDTHHTVHQKQNKTIYKENRKDLQYFPERVVFLFLASRVTFLKGFWLLPLTLAALFATHSLPAFVQEREVIMIIINPFRCLLSVRYCHRPRRKSATAEPPLRPLQKAKNLIPVSIPNTD